MAHGDRTSSLDPSRVRNPTARTLGPKHVLGAIGLLIGGVLVLAAVVVGLVLVEPSIEHTLDGLARIGWLFIFVFFMGWSMDNKLVRAQKERAAIRSRFIVEYPFRCRREIFGAPVPAVTKALPSMFDGFTRLR